MPTWIPALVAGIIVASTALMARWVMLTPSYRVHTWLPWIQAMTAGLLLGDGLLHMLPEAVARGVSVGSTSGAVVMGMLLLVCMENAVRTLSFKGDIAAFARMDVLGDALHHGVDGVVIGAAFTLDPVLGAVVAVTILLHELPRSVGHAGVLVAGGYLPGHAFRLSMLATTATPLGAVGAVWLAHVSNFVGASLAFAAGCTIYLACADILPAVWQRLDSRSRLAPVTGMVGGVAFMWVAALVDHAH